MRVELIAACDHKGVIGTADGGLPWDLPRDRAHFRRQASGTCMLLGRRTFEEMHGWFTNQQPLVLSRDPEYRPIAPGIAVSSLGEALATARSLHSPRLLVAGGAAVFAAAFPLADRLIITHIDVDWQQQCNDAPAPRDSASGDLPRFPDIDPCQWRRVRRQHFPTDADHPWPLDFCWYQREAHPDLPDSS